MFKKSISEQGNLMTMTSPTKFRNYSLDLIKIISCMLVVMMHTFRHFDQSVSLHPILYYLTRCSMPLFFMAAGAIQLNKNNVDYHYCFVKVLHIIFIMVGYYFCDILIRVIIYKSIPISTSELIAMIKKLYWDFGVFWFLRTMIYIYLVLPLLHYVYNKKPLLLIGIFITICSCIDIASVLNILKNNAESYLQSNIMQEFRFWSWILYYCLGAYIYANYTKIKIPNQTLLCSVIITGLLAILYMVIMFKVETNIINAEYAYDSILMIIWSTLIMIYLLKINFEKYKNIIKIGTSLLIPIYALHVFIIKLFENYTIFQTYFTSLLGYCIILIITALIGFIMTKIPFIKRFTYI